MDAFASLGKIFQNAGGGPNWGNIAKGGLTGFGLIGNILAQQKQNAALNRIAYYQKNPAAAAQMVESLTQPLSQGLIKDVGNNVQGYLAERGLSGSPNITTGVLGQTLAPYELQNQQAAEQEFFNLLNPAGATYAKPADMTSLLQLWKPLASVTAPGAPSPTISPNISLPLPSAPPPPIDTTEGLDLFGSY